MAPTLGAGARPWPPWPNGQLPGRVPTAHPVPRSAALPVKHLQTASTCSTPPPPARKVRAQLLHPVLSAPPQLQLLLKVLDPQALRQLRRRRAPPRAPPSGNHRPTGTQRIFTPSGLLDGRSPRPHSIDSTRAGAPSPRSAARCASRVAAGAHCGAGGCARSRQGPSERWKDGGLEVQPAVGGASGGAPGPAHARPAAEPGR